MSIDKGSYHSIPVSEELDRVIGDSIRRAERELRIKNAVRWMSCVVALFFVMFIGANIKPIYSYASQLPVIGTLVQVLHIGTGGVITDGAQTEVSVQGENVDIYFERYTEDLDAAPFYSIEHLLAPNRIILTFHGVRNVNFTEIQDSFLATEAVKDVYRAMICDDSMWGFVIILNSGYTYEISEYTNPGYLSLRFYTDEHYHPEQRIYYLRSEQMPYDENLGLISELYYMEGATQLKTGDDSYIITIGQYESLSEAEEALELLEETYGDDIGFTVSSGLADEIPDN